MSSCSWIRTPNRARRVAMSHSPLTHEPDRPTQGEELMPPLEQGDRLDQPTFHARYEAMPPDTRAELIGGVVHMPSPAKRPHSRTVARVVRWLGAYEDA